MKARLPRSPPRPDRREIGGEARNPRSRSPTADQGTAWHDPAGVAPAGGRRGQAGVLTHEAMRGPSAWSIGDRELMAAFVSQANDAPFCVTAHSATSSLWYGDDAKVAATLADLDSAPIDEPLRATLRMLGKLTRAHTVDADDIREVLAAGASRQQIEDALAVCL